MTQQQTDTMPNPINSSLPERTVERTVLEVEPTTCADDACVCVQTKRVAVLCQRPSDKRVPDLTV